MRTSRTAPPLSGRLLSCREAAKLLDVSDDTVRRMIRAGELEGVRIGKRILRVFGESLDRCMQTQTEVHRLDVNGEATWSVRTDTCSTSGSQSEGGVA